MIYSLFGFNYIFNLQNFQLLFFAASLGLYLRLLLSVISHQLWLKNYSQYLVFALLPITGYVITSIISSNIALSLGMVGALSIVRFRTPVKNPSELVIYFCLITIGIVINVNPSTALEFMFFVTIIIVVTEIYALINKKFKLNTLLSSNEDFSYLKITSNRRYEELESKKELFHFSMDDNFYYQFRSSSIEALKLIEESFDKSSILTMSMDAPSE